MVTLYSLALKALSRSAAQAKQRSLWESCRAGIGSGVGGEQGDEQKVSGLARQAKEGLLWGSCYRAGADSMQGTRGPGGVGHVRPGQQGTADWTERRLQ